MPSLCDCRKFLDKPPSSPGWTVFYDLNLSFTDSDESFNPESGAEDQNLKEE